MARALRQLWVARLLATGLSFALIVASLAGTTVHARDHSQHHHWGVSHADGHAHAGHSAAIVATADAGGLTSLSHDVPAADPRHNGCLDFLCHGGVAILAMGAGLQIAGWREPLLPFWPSDALSAVRPAALERPPKSLHSA